MSLPSPNARTVSWREVVWPKEHGSWSLALEPVALGLIAAASVAGAALAVAVVAGFFLRRPLRIALLDAQPERRSAARTAIGAAAALLLAGVVAASWLGGVGWWLWALPTAAAGAAFVRFDLQQAGREQAAELAGSFAFAWLPALFATLAGWGAGEAAGLGLLMVGRSVPTVLTVRAAVRARKLRERPAVWPLAVALLAAAGALALWRLGFGSGTAVIATVVLAARSAVLLLYPRPSLRASVLGMIEAVLGLGFVVAVGLAAWAAGGR